MDERSESGGVAESADLADLKARVAELERVVAAFTRNAGATRDAGSGILPARRAAPVAPPPRVAPAIAGPPVAAEDAASMAPMAPIARLAGVAAVRAPEGKTLENRLGAQVFNLVGILALVIAAAYGLKLAIEHGYLGPVARVLIGIAAGVAAVLWSERLRRKGMVAFSYSLKALGSALLYLSLWAAFHLYHLLPAGAALGAMVLVTAWNAFMAWSQDSELLAGYALAGGFLSPLLLSAGGDHEAFLFLYLGAIDLALVILLRLKPWRALVLPAFGATVLFFVGWYVQFFHHQAAVWDRQSTETAAFALMFGAIFAVVPLRGASAEIPGDVIVPVLLPLGYGLFEGLALFSVMQESGVHADLAWLMVALAAVYLLLMRFQRAAVSKAIHLAVAVVFLTVAIPLKASGHTLTTAWLVEGLVLLWASTKFAAEEQQARRVLWGLSGAGYALGLASLVAHWFLGSALGMDGFFNRDLGAAAVAIVTLAGAVWLALQAREVASEGLSLAGLMAIDGVAVLLCLRELGSAWTEEGRHQAFANASFATSLVGLAVLATVAWVAMRLRRMDEQRFASMAILAGATLIGFNLLAILSIEREIGALWHRGEEDLQRSLAISGFLMLYGAGLLAIGFIKRSAFVRWQALVLLLFTICKVFLYDISGLSAGYRVVSFMGLGAVLLGISYAYQKDWLGLKEPVTPKDDQAGAA